MQLKNENGDISLLIDTRANPSSGAIFHLLMKNVTFSTRDDPEGNSFFMEDGFIQIEVKAIHSRSAPYGPRGKKELFTLPSLSIIKKSRGITTIHQIQDPRAVMQFPLIFVALKKREREELMNFNQDYSQDQF